MTTNAPTQQSPEPPIGRRERRKLEVRTRIYTAAKELFAKRGFEATTVDEIARVADVAPATFFNHFQTKQALLTLMTGEVVEHLHTITVESFERPGAATIRLRNFVERAATDIAENRSATVRSASTTSRPSSPICASACSIPRSRTGSPTPSTRSSKASSRRRRSPSTHCAQRTEPDTRHGAPR